MRKLAFVVTVIWGAVSYQQAMAQTVWYVPSGDELGYYYGLNLGNGFGFGYGIGFGVPIPVDSAIGAAVTNGANQNQVAATTSQPVVNANIVPQAMLPPKKAQPVKKPQKPNPPKNVGQIQEVKKN